MTDWIFCNDCAAEVVEGSCSHTRPVRRKVIQISVHQACIHALCNDGSIWWTAPGIDWTRVPDIPQEGE